MEELKAIVIRVFAGSTGVINFPLESQIGDAGEGGAPGGSIDPPPQVYSPESGTVGVGVGSTDMRRCPPVTVGVIGESPTLTVVELIVGGQPFGLAELYGEGEMRISCSTIRNALRSARDEMKDASLRIRFERPDPEERRRSHK